MDKTITVTGHFGDKEVTERQFVSQWVTHVSQLYRLAGNQAQVAWVDKIKNETEKTAKSEFNRILKEKKNAK